MRDLRARPIALTPEEVPRARRYIAKRCRRNGDCIEWVGQVNSSGRPTASLPARQGPRRVYAYRLVWTVYMGEIPEGMHVCHKCDNPLCVNLRHLFLGTHLDNMRDMVSKGRNPHRTYTPEQRCEAIRAWHSGEWPSRAQLAEHLGIPAGTLFKWLRGDISAMPEVREERARVEASSRAPEVIVTWRTGEANSRARLTDQQVAEIRAAFKQPGGPGTPSNAGELAATYGITKQYVGQLVKGTWRRDARTGVPVPSHVCRVEAS